MNKNRFFSISQLATATGLDRRTIAKKLSSLKSYPGPGKSVLYDGHEAFPALFKDTRSSTELEHSIQVQQLRLSTAKAEAAERELSKSRQELVPLDEVANHFIKHNSILRTRLRVIPTATARVLANESN